MHSCELLKTNLNKMICSLVARVVNIPCLIGIARCLEAFQCVAELVLLHNRCQTVPLNELFIGGYLSPVRQVPRESTRCGEPATSASFYSTLLIAAPCGICVPFHTWCLFPTWSPQSFKTTSRFHKEFPPQVYNVQCFSPDFLNCSRIYFDP